MLSFGIITAINVITCHGVGDLYRQRRGTIMVDSVPGSASLGAVSHLWLMLCHLSLMLSHVSDSY